MTAFRRALAPGVVAAILFTAASLALERGGLASWRFFGDLNATGPGTFSQFAQSIGAVALRVIGIIAVWAAVTVLGAGGERREWAAPLAGTFAILLLIGVAAAALVVPTFGLSVVAYLVFMAYAFAGTVMGERAPIDAVVDSIRIAASRFGFSFRAAVIVAAAVIASAFADALSGGAAAAVFGGWLVVECAAAYTGLAAADEYARQAP